MCSNRVPITKKLVIENLLFALAPIVACTDVLMMKRFTFSFVYFIVILALERTVLMFYAFFKLSLGIPNIAGWKEELKFSVGANQFSGRMDISTLLCKVDIKIIDLDSRLEFFVNHIASVTHAMQTNKTISEALIF